MPRYFRTDRHRAGAFLHPGAGLERSRANASSLAVRSPRHCVRRSLIDHHATHRKFHQLGCSSERGFRERESACPGNKRRDEPPCKATTKLIAVLTCQGDEPKRRATPRIDSPIAPRGRENLFWTPPGWRQATRTTSLTDNGHGYNSLDAYGPRTTKPS